MSPVSLWGWSMLLLVVLIGTAWGALYFMMASARIGRQLVDHVRLYGYTSVVHENLIEMRFWERLATLLAFTAGMLVTLLLLTGVESVRRLFLDG